MRQKKPLIYSHLINDATQRFSGKVDDYIKYRPGYSPALIDFLSLECRLTPDCIIADVGSGTGLMTELFLKNGNVVYGIEPNREMHEAAESRLKGYAEFRSVEASAESTTLNSSSVDFVTVGRALHWFDFQKALLEFSRILKPQGWIVIVWLKRKSSSAFLVEYDDLLTRYAKEHKQKKERQLALEGLLKAAAFKRKALEDEWVFDFENLQGLTLSFSVSPRVGDPNHAPLLGALHSLFGRYQDNGMVTISYETLIYYGRPGSIANLLTAQRSHD